jgi:hypothetical protein
MGAGSFPRALRTDSVKRGISLSNIRRDHSQSLFSIAHLSALQRTESIPAK